MTRPTEWAPGLVALYTACEGGNNHAVARTAHNVREWVICADLWDVDDLAPWDRVAFSWPKTPVWVGTPEEWHILRTGAESPQDLLATAKRLSADAAAAEAEIQAMWARTLCAKRDAVRNADAFERGRVEGIADVSARLRAVIDPEDRHHLNLDGLMAEVARFKREARNYLANVDEAIGTINEANNILGTRPGDSLRSRASAVIAERDDYKRRAEAAESEIASVLRRVSEAMWIHAPLTAEEVVDEVESLKAAAVELSEQEYDTQEIDDLKAQIRDLEARLATVHALTSPPAPEVETIDRLEDAREGSFYRDADGVLFYAGARNTVSRHACAVHAGWHFEPALPARFVQQGQPGIIWWKDVKDEAARRGLV